MRLTESRNATRKQLLMMPTEQLTHREWLPGEHLNGSECLKTQTLFRPEISENEKTFLHGLVVPDQST